MRFLKIHSDGSFSLTRNLVGNYPPYAILSHRWGADEVTLDDFKDGTATGKDAYRKIAFCGKQALSDNLHYFWVDTCCIDKSNSVELQEAINSMFKWYRDAAKCYVYLADVSVKRKAQEGALDLGAWQAAFRASDWFKRGWTLQELLAPSTVEFFSLEGRQLGDKKSLENYIHEITHISERALRGSPLTLFTQDERFSWARGRQTTKEEDKAYSLLGIFDVHMPLIYGEGQQNAFRRLQEEISKSTGVLPQQLTLTHASMVTRPNTNVITLPSQQGSPGLGDEQKKLLLESLRFDQIDARQMTIKNAHAKTCRWFLKAQAYVDWLDPSKVHEHNGFLWIKGNPGTGKSTLMKFALATARRTMKSSIVLGFFFNARGEDMEKSTLGAYQSLLLQLLEQVPRLQCVFDFLDPSNTNPARDNRWTEETLKMLLEQAILLLGDTAVVCFVDALDECEEHFVRDMLSFFEHVSERTVSEEIKYHMCFSSRHYPHITVRKGLELVLERQEGHDLDLTQYLDSELKIGHSRLAEDIRSEVRGKASGIFMWVVLVVRILNEEFDSGRIHVLRRRLKELPGDLHELFRDILTKDSRNREELLLAIQWVLFARQPLKAEQLYHAILVGTHPEAVVKWDPCEITSDVLRRFILSSSKGLAEITTSKDPRVQFIHESVKDFLLKGNGLAAVWPDLGTNFEGESQQQLKLCCLRYFDIYPVTNLEYSLPLPKASSEAARALRASTAEDYPLLEYAVRSVLHHADAAARTGLAQDRFLLSFPLAPWIMLDNLFEKFGIRRHSERATLLYILAENDLANLIRTRNHNTTLFDVGYERYGPPLLAAIATGSENAVEALVDVHVSEHLPGDWYQGQRIDSSMSKASQRVFGRDFKYHKRRDVLSYLAESGREVLVRLLLDTTEVRINSEDKDRCIALSYASEHGHAEIVRLLLETGEVRVDPIDAQHRSSLAWAAQGGHEAVVKLLLETEKVDVNLKYTDGNFPLLLAAQGGHEAVVKLLLDTGKVDMHPRDTRLNTPLLLAASGGHEAIVKLLLEAEKVLLDSPNTFGRTPLSAAAVNGHDGVVKLLFAAGIVDMNAKDGKGLAPLSLAAMQGHEEVVKLLLAKDEVDVNTRDKEGLTPLSWATRRGHEAVVRLLLAAEKVEVDLGIGEG